MIKNLVAKNKNKISDSGLSFSLSCFDGPLDLLLNLIEKNKMDIYDIAIHEITEQYLAILKDAPDFEVNTASDFLQMAATLIYIKSRMLLPEKSSKDNEEDEFNDPRTELLLQLLAYKRCKYLAGIIKEKHLIYKNTYLKEESLPSCLGLEDKKLVYPPLSQVKFWKAVDNIILRNKARFNDLSDKMTAILRKERLPMYMCLENLWRQILYGKKVSFFELANNDEVSTRLSSFLALLELMKFDHVEVEQKLSFGDIVIERKLSEMSQEMQEFIRILEKEEGLHYG